MRSTADQKIAGVCSGLGRRLQIDPATVRLFFVAAFFSPFFTLILTIFLSLYDTYLFMSVVVSALSVMLYLALWLVMPSDQRRWNVAMQTQYGRQQPQMVDQPNSTGEWQFDPFTGERIRR
jgi:phage shock protein PspC (stress-responsive transcriptional regulator)